MASEDFANRMRLIAQAKAVEGGVKPDKVANVAKQFFEKEVLSTATNKIRQRAEDGYYTANVLEYNYDEYFRFDDDGNVVRVENFKARNGAFVHRIFNVVHSDEFQELLKKFVAELGDMEFWCGWTKRDKLNVVSVDWLPKETREERKLAREAKKAASDAKKAAKYAVGEDDDDAMAEMVDTVMVALRPALLAPSADDAKKAAKPKKSVSKA
jgi:hypothetical protein